jgi:2-polyprenyl-6-methoxyphenol hydroxylase-like FAD-dependent oxidoreductase
VAKALIIGAGICGLGTALLLARDGHEVTVVDRDAGPLPKSPRDAWDQWNRKGIAQFRQPHNFMPGLRLLLEANLPELAQALPAAGATKLDMFHPLPPFFSNPAPQPIDDKLWTYTARRPAGEWVFADAAERIVRVRRGTRVTGFLTGASVRNGTPHVTGVRTDQGEELRADTVIDAMGRASRSPQWLVAIGAREPYEEETDCGFAYYSRYFQGRVPERIGPLLTQLGTISVLTLPGDHETWSVTIFGASDDKPLKALRDLEKWTNTIRACPLHAHWLDGVPITDVLSMTGVVDRYRSFVVDGAPVATGLLAVGDAWASTNPSAGRGLTVGMMQAVRLRDTLREVTDDPWTLVQRYHEVTEAEVTPWYRSQIAMDRARFAEIEALREGRERPALEDPFVNQVGSLMSSMTADLELFRAGLEYVATLTPIDVILERPRIAQRLDEVMKSTSGTSALVLPGPNRQALLDILS